MKPERNSFVIGCNQPLNPRWCKDLAAQIEFRVNWSMSWQSKAEIQAQITKALGFYPEPTNNQYDWNRPSGLMGEHYFRKYMGGGGEADQSWSPPAYLSSMEAARTIYPHARGWNYRFEHVEGFGWKGAAQRPGLGGIAVYESPYEHWLRTSMQLRMLAWDFEKGLINEYGRVIIQS